MEMHEKVVILLNWKKKTSKGVFFFSMKNQKNATKVTKIVVKLTIVVKMAKNKVK